MNLNPGSLRRRRLSLHGEGGFTLIEAITSMVILAGLAAAMAGLLTSAISSNKLARQRTIADQAALEHIESIRRLPYDDVGTVSGNPPGTVEVTRTVTFTGFDATITTQIRYVDDPTPTSYETTANYKRVVVTVTRNSDGKVLAREVTYVAPTSRTPYGGVNLAIIEPLVIDYGLNVPVEGATVNLANGPSPNRSDVTDATGKVSFKKLEPNPSASCPPDCYDLTAALTGYEQLDSPTQVNVAPGQTAAPTIQIYLPSTINVVVRNPDGTPFTGTASVKLTSARNGATQTFAVSGGSAAITAVAGEKIVPSVQYTAEAWTTGTPLCATETQYVPDDYPTVLSSTFTLTLGTCPGGTVVATVNWPGNVPAPGATVTLSGGQYLLNPVSGTTDASGQVTFSDVPSGPGYTVEASLSGQLATDSSVSVTTGDTTNVTLTLTGGSLTVQVRWAGFAVNTATVRVTGGPSGSVDVTQTTPSSGNTTFSGLAPGGGYTVQATKSGQTTTLTNVTVAVAGTTVTVNLPTTTLVVHVNNSSGVSQAGASVRVNLGPLGSTFNVTGTTNASGDATFTNVPMGTGYRIRAWNCSVASPRSRNVTSQTVTTTPITNKTLTYNSSTCPP